MWSLFYGNHTPGQASTYSFEKQTKSQKQKQTQKCKNIKFSFLR